MPLTSVEADFVEVEPIVTEASSDEAIQAEGETTEDETQNKREQTENQ